MDAIVVGGGISGLVCANKLEAAGVNVSLFEAADAVGGRIRTDVVDGFRLDRGFQVFLTGYPEAKAMLDYEALDLKSFEPGALIQINGKTDRLVDPWRRPQHLLATAMSAAGTIGDKLRVAGVRRTTSRGTIAELYESKERTTLEWLHDRGFSDSMIRSFFRPFFGGVFLDQKLETSSRLFEFLFRMFSSSEVTVPAKGMEEIPRQLARRLAEGTIRTGTRVQKLEGQTVTLESGEQHSADVIVMATESPFAKGQFAELAEVSSEYRSVKCLYFAASAPPFTEPILMLNGDGRGPINNLCVPTLVSGAYSTSGESLVSVTCLDGESTLNQVTEHLTEWFGAGVADWRHLKTYDIPYALPVQSPPGLSPVEKSPRVRPGAYACGDYFDTASINGAMASGRRCAEAILADAKG